MNKLLQVLLSVFLTCSFVSPQIVLAEEIETVEEALEEEIVEEEPVFSCGQEAIFVLEGNVLTISGTGKVDDSSEWDKQSIVRVVIEEGITELAPALFQGFSNLEVVKLPLSMQYIGSLCFDGCPESLRVEMDDSLDTSSWAEDWFCEKVEEIVVEGEIPDEHWHISEDFEPEISPYFVQIDGDDCFIPGESKSYTATLYENVDGVVQKVSGASYSFQENSNYVSFSKNNGNTCTVEVSSAALDNNVVGFYLWCDVTYGSIHEQGWKYVYIENEYYTLDILGMTPSSTGNYLLNKGRQAKFSLDLIRHYYDGSFQTQSVSTTNEFDFEVENVEIYDDSNTRVYFLVPGNEYVMKHMADSTDVMQITGWVKNSKDDLIKVTKDITIEADPKASSLLGHSLSLSGNIGVNYFLSLNDTTSSDEEAYMEFVLNGSSMKTFVKDAKQTTIEGMDCFQFTCPVSAKDMTSIIVSKLVDGQGNVLVEDTYSVDSYVQTIVNNSSKYTSEQVNIVKTMSTYGYYAQQYFDYQVDRLPSVVNPLEEVDFSEYAYTLNNTSDLVFVGARLVLTSKPGLKLYFIGDAQFMVNGEVVPTSLEGKYRVITISDIDNMKEMYLISAPDFDLSYGMFSYAYQASQKDNVELINLLKAMYAYNANF